MSSKSDLLKINGHRPYPFPESAWMYYQEWHNAVMIHWKVAPEKLQTMLPYRVKSDLFNGEAWVSLVAFTGKKLHPRFLPSFSPLSDFDEINIRTYVVYKNHPGIYFLSVEAGKKLSAKLARFITGLPYLHSEIKLDKGKMQAVNYKKRYAFNALYEEGSLISKDALDKWLTERYCVYQERKNKLYAFEIHHPEWPLQNVTLREANAIYNFNTFRLDRLVPERAHFAKELPVLLWTGKQV